MDSCEIPQEKYYCFVVSTGRTATQYLGSNAQIAFQDCYSEHEPDMVRSLTDFTLRKIRLFGLYRLTLGKLIGSTGIRNLSNGYLSGSISQENAAREIVHQRGKFYQEIEQSLVVESYSRWYGLIDPLSLAIERFKVVGIVRDPRTWVTSWMLRAKEYGDAHRSAGAVLKMSPLFTSGDIGDRKYEARWDTMSGFERLCWQWKAINNIILDASECYDNVRVFKFEEVFADGENGIRPVFDFMAQFNDRNFDYSLAQIELTRKANASQADTITEWKDWEPDRQARLYDICGDTMLRLGYEF